MVYMKTSELLHLTGTKNSSWGAVQWEGDAAEHGGAPGGTAEQVSAWGRMLSWPWILLPCTST